MTEVYPLYYYGEPTEEQRIALRKGKELMGVDFMVQPKRVTAPGVGVTEAVLCFEEPPFFFWSGYAILTPPYTPNRMAAALDEIYCTNGAAGDYLTQPEDWLSKQFGRPVKLLFEEEVPE